MLGEQIAPIIAAAAKAEGYRLLPVQTAPVVMNAMRRLLAPAQPDSLAIPDMLKLQTEPRADCGRYDHLREVSHAIH